MRTHRISDDFKPPVAMSARLLLLPLLLGAALAATPCNAQQRPQIRLEQDLVIGEATGATFGELLRVGVSSRGTIYVGDWSNASVIIFSARGAALDTIGRRGRGPGEFTAVHDLTVGRGDSLYVFDANAMRLSVFGGADDTHRLAYSVMPETGEFGRPFRVLIPNDARAPHLFVFRNAATGTISVHSVLAGGSVESRPVLQGAAAQSRVDYRTSGGGAEIVRTSPLFGRGPVVGITKRNEVYYGWTEKVDLTFFSLTGKQESIFRAESREIPVTSREVGHALREASEARRRALAQAEHPKTMPAFHTAIVDDESRIWTGRYTSDPDRHEWWVTLDYGRGETAILSLPSNIDLQVVRNGYAYAASVDGDGAPTVVRFRVTVLPRK
ncbi:MAG: 6-bladed beta-propeller [Gemmatimonadaceae bacterium]|nr:6-bladed beta-propeller [Gemmatimonadaceae bacterium]